MALQRFIGEGDFFGVRLKEEIEGVDDRHFGHQIHLNPELTGFFREDEARQVVALRVLLPVDEMRFRADFQRVRKNAGTGMRTRPQADQLRPEIDQAVIAVVR